MINERVFSDHFACVHIGITRDFCEPLLPIYTASFLKSTHMDMFRFMEDLNFTKGFFGAILNHLPGRQDIALQCK